MRDMWKQFSSENKEKQVLFKEMYGNNVFKTVEEEVPKILDGI